MAQLNIESKKILGNIRKLDKYLKKHNIEWSLILKILSGNKEVLEKILHDPVIKNLHSLGDSRLSNLKRIKKIRPDLVTMYIKPPAIQYAKSVVKVADISYNTSYRTLEALNEEAAKLDKIHRVIIMIELGELREGINRHKLLDFYSKTFALDNIKIIGVGTNLGCMYGVGPTYDKLIQLVLYKQLIEAKFDKDIELVSGGSSITLPLIGKRRCPKSVNHFRIGEAVFLGTSPLTTKKFRDLSDNAFTFSASIIELEKKDNIPIGHISDGNVGHAVEIEQGEYEKVYRAILDFGIIDVDVQDIEPTDPHISFQGTTSDMTVYNIEEGKNHKYKVGDMVDFSPNYMAVARLMSARYINKIVK